MRSRRTHQVRMNALTCAAAFHNSLRGKHHMFTRFMAGCNSLKSSKCKNHRRRRMYKGTRNRFEFQLFAFLKQRVVVCFLFFFVNWKSRVVFPFNGTSQKKGERKKSVWISIFVSVHKNTEVASAAIAGGSSSPPQRLAVLLLMLLLSDGKMWWPRLCACTRAGFHFARRPVHLDTHLTRRGRERSWFSADASSLSKTT